MANERFYIDCPKCGGQYDCFVSLGFVVEGEPGDVAVCCMECAPEFLSRCSVAITEDNAVNRAEAAKAMS